MALSAKLILSLVLVASGFTIGWKTQGWRWEAFEAERLRSEAAAKTDALAKADKAAENHEAEKAKLQQQFVTIYRDVEHVVEKPVYHNVCIDADGLRIIAKAIGNSPAASQPEATVSEPVGTK